MIPLSEAGTQAERDAAEADALYGLLENEVIPLFYTRGSDGVPTGWVAKVRASLRELAPFYSTNRMIREYLTDIYQPAMQLFRQRDEAPQETSAELARWEHDLREHWHEIRLGQATAGRDGARFHVTVPVTLGDVNPEGIGVEIYADATGELPVVCQALRRDQPMPGTTNGFFYVTDLDDTRPLAHFTARVVPQHSGALVPLELPLICWATGPLVAAGG